ncbi:MAG: NUDIX domain-containing protein [Acidimicrobiaceae bacterium]|nr:NUDIX domain-containing protein [Acidimicrobiaceae bacterium]
MLLDDLTRTLASIDPVDAREEHSIALTLDRLTWNDDPFDEFGDDHHLTASAFIISSRGVILHRHRRLGIWVQPGGHIDPGESPSDAAVRESLEETGLVARHVDPELLFHVDVHPGPRGHTHYDLRFVLTAEPIEPTPAPGESTEVYWFDFVAARERCEPGLVAALVKLSGLALS